MERSTARPFRTAFCSRPAGFTLLELLITLAIFAILAAGAVGLGNLIDRSRMSGNVNQLLADLNLARSEAVKRKTLVIICKGATGTGCAATSEWHAGWIVFADPNENKQADPGETVLREQGRLSGTHLSVNVGTSVAYKPNGSLHPLGRFTFCSAGKAVTPRTVTIYRTGRARVSDDDPLPCP